jgi:hypothetical protein
VVKAHHMAKREINGVTVEVDSAGIDRRHFSANPTFEEPSDGLWLRVRKQGPSRMAHRLRSPDISIARYRATPRSE